MPPAFSPRRSCLYMPGTNTRALDKARSLPCDVVIMDLEDAVSADKKKEARDTVCAALTSGGYGYRELWVRINALNTAWGETDLRRVAKHSPHAIIVPKVDDADDIMRANALLCAADQSSAIALWAMIESPAAILNLARIAAASTDSRLAGLIVGGNDLAKDLRLDVTPDRQALLYALSQTVTAGRAYALDVLDGVFNDIDDAAGLINECTQGRQLGFDGKTLIHPKQIESANRLFTPSPQAISQAQAVIDAFSDPENCHLGVIKVGGQMTERLHLEQAERLIAYYEALQQR